MSVSLADRLEIQEVIARQQLGHRHRRWRGRGRHVHAGGSFTMRDRQFEGHEALVSFGSGSNTGPAKPDAGSQHWVANLVLEGDGEFHSWSFTR